MAAILLSSAALCFPSQNPNRGSKNRKNFGSSSSPAYFNPSIVRYQDRLSAFGPPSFPSFCANRGHGRMRTRRPRTHIFLPHLVASMEVLEETYVMVKPDGVQRGLVGDIISRFEKKGFLLKGLKLFQCPKELAEEHYKELKDKSFYHKLINYITSGPVVCMAWEGIGVVASARKLIGATNPLQAEPGTIRGDLAVQTGRDSDFFPEMLFMGVTALIMDIVKLLSGSRKMSCVSGYQRKHLGSKNKRGDKIVIFDGQLRVFIYLFKFIFLFAF